MIKEVMGCHGHWNGRLIRHEADQVQSKGNTKIDRPFIVIFVANQNIVRATDIVRQIHNLECRKNRFCLIRACDA
jgi:hypothetical protein